MASTCRAGCGACCVAPSISAAMPGLPLGKPAGVPCPHLTADVRCALWGTAARPAVCSSLRPEPAMCGSTAAEALMTLGRWERETAPASGDARR
jgi:uncharacterized protein